jgi:ABC-2 type transport system ATP-binding protein
VPVIRTEALSKIYSPGLGKAKISALQDLTMSVEEREIFGFLGPNGAGKTTTMKILMGLIFPTGGQAWIFDRPIGDPDAKRRLGFLPEHPYFYDQLTGNEILDYFGRLFGIDAPTRAKRSKDLLERVGLGGAANQPLRGYSKGMLQRVGIAQALINDPELVVLDEPMSGLDPVGRKEVRDLILSLRAERRTVFFSTHILSDVEVVCDRVAILAKGKVAALSPLQDLLQMAGDEMEVILVDATPAARSKLASVSGARIADSGDRLVVRLPQHDVSQVMSIARDDGGKVLSVSPARRSLEEIFLQIAGKGTL